MKRLTFEPQNGMSPSWSPDGSRMVFASTRNGRLEIFTMQADGSSQDMLVSMPGASVLDPRWSPDGARVAFVQVPTLEEKAARDELTALCDLRDRVESRRVQAESVNRPNVRRLQSGGPTSAERQRVPSEPVLALSQSLNCLNALPRCATASFRTASISPSVAPYGG